MFNRVSNKMFNLWIKISKAGTTGNKKPAEAGLVWVGSGLLDEFCQAEDDCHEAGSESPDFPGHGVELFVKFGTNIADSLGQISLREEGLL